LEAHLTTHSRLWHQGPQEERKLPQHTSMLVADAGDQVVGMHKVQRLIQNQPVTKQTKEKSQPQPNYSIWAAPFNSYVRQAAQGDISSFSNEVAGAIAAFEYHPSNFLLGGGLGYAFNYTHFSEHLGHGKLQEEMAFLYGAFKQKYVWINAALWGGLYQVHSERHTLSLITSKTHTHGWILSPHIEVAAPFEVIKTNRLSMEPFLMFDWVNNWQHHFTEKGRSGFNVVMKDQYNSLLRSELGLRLYEQLHYNWGKLLFEEKLSYINQAPFHVQRATTFFVASASTFPVATGSSKVQNLGGVGVQASFLPWNQSYPYGTLNFQGEFGSSSQLYFVSAELGMNF
jgi:hypothetical protein